MTDEIIYLYFASSYEGKFMVNMTANHICNKVSEASGLHVLPASRWHSVPAVLDNSHTDTDLSDIEKAIAVVGLYPYGYGTCSELGYSLGRGKPTYFVYDEHFKDDLPFIAHSSSMRKYPINFELVWPEADLIRALTKLVETYHASNKAG